MKASKKNDRQGSGTVEFALVFPLFIMFLFGGVEMARLNMLRHVADNAAYEAARYGIVPGATVAEIEQRAQAYLQTTRVVNAAINVTPDPLDEGATEVTVSVAVPLEGNAWVVPNFTEDITIESSATLKAERYRGIQ